MHNSKRSSTYVCPATVSGQIYIYPVRHRLIFLFCFIELDKSSADVAAEGAILNEMLEIVAKRAALRPTASQVDLTAAGAASTSTDAGITLADQAHDHEESNVGFLKPKRECNN